MVSGRRVNGLVVGGSVVGGFNKTPRKSARLVLEKLKMGL